jgi:threonine-phosphate decarboxylase
MRRAEDLARESVRKLKPCVHGGEVWDVAVETGRSLSDLVEFSSSVNPLGPSVKALAAVREGFSRLTFYPDSYSSALREAIALHYGLNKSSVIVGNGSTELIYLFAEVFLERGDVALVASPSFGEYESAVCKAGGKVNHVPLDSDFNFDAGVFKRELHGAKMLFLCNPNNPTGMLVEHDKLIEIVESAVTGNVLVFLDEDFIEFVDDETGQSLISMLKQFSNLFILRTFTKFYGLTGLRVGFGLADDGIINVLARVKMPWSVNSLGQAAAAAALTDDAHNEKTRALIRVERQFMLKELAKLKGFKVYPSDANYIFLDVRKSGFSSAQLREHLLEHGLLIRDCSSFHGLDGFFVRLAVRTRGENERLLASFREVLGA